MKLDGGAGAHIDPGAWDLLEMCWHADNGTWPVGGGVLDQTAAFLYAYRWVRGEKVRVEKELSSRK
ncbi:MAG TPA: hypothetical protein VGE74_17895 [Gemmata sp.]